ncbi:L,D-transpeptidase [Kitasatospora sp. NPDC051853]|uniref:L,D-transpeptidase n=1 Tax=Kitasatospora sp. NPDC051853 TaxID=3364058 RepID=UPI00379E526C
MHEGDGTPEQHDELTVLLRGLAAEAPTALPLPYEVLRRNGRARRRRRQTGLAALGTVLAIGGGAVFWPGGGPGAGTEDLSGRPAPVVSTVLGTPPPSPTAAEEKAAEEKAAVPAPVEGLGPSPLPPGQVRAVVDLSSADLRVNGTDAARPCSVGGPGTPTPAGRMTVISRQRVVVVDSQTGPFLNERGETWYHLELKWAVELSAADGTSTWVAEMPWRPVGGKAATSGDIGLRAEDARWFFERVAVGDTVEVRN